MQTRRKKKNRLPLILIAAVLIIGIATGVVLAATGALEGLFKTPADQPFQVEGDITAMRLAATGEGATEEELRTYYTGAVTFAQQNGIDTLVYEAKEGITVAWRDKIFPTLAAVTANDSLFNKTDPLALLLEATENSGVQVLLSVDPFSALGYESGMKGKAAKLAEKRGGASLFSFPASDADYLDLLTTSLSALPESYAVSGVLFTGITAEELSATGLTETLKTAWQQAGYPTTQVGLALPAGETDLSYISSNLDLITAQVASGDKLAARLEALNGEVPVVLEATGENQPLVLFTAHGLGLSGGTLVASYPTAADEATIATLQSATTTASGPLPTGFVLDHTLAVTNPGQGTGTTQGQYWVTGVCDPSLPLTVNGEEVETVTETGLFGVLVELPEVGEHTFTFTQGGSTTELLLKRIAPTTGTGGAAPTFTTEAAPEGTGVRVSFQYVSALTDPYDTSTIDETFYENATAVVTNIIKRNDVDWAYQLTDGNWILADTAERTALPTASFSGLSATPHENGEYIQFEGTGTPAAYVAYVAASNQLKITMYDTAFTLPGSFSSTYVSAASTEPTEDGQGVVLSLSLNTIGGYNLEYADGQTRLFLKRPVSLSPTPGQPLAGVHIMLDPGHGDTDIGAHAGVVGLDSELGGPYEKDMSLAVGQIIAYRLRQLGAEVTMTRDDDSLLTIYERLAYQNEVKPDLFLSLHHNSFDPYSDISTIGGVEAWYYHPYPVGNSKLLAWNAATRISELTGRNARGGKWSTYVVTRTTVCPSVLVEFGFVGNPYEYEDLISTDGLYTEAEAVVEAILATLEGTDLSGQL